MSTLIKKVLTGGILQQKSQGLKKNKKVKKKIFFFSNSRFSEEFSHFLEKKKC